MALSIDYDLRLIHKKVLVTTIVAVMIASIMANDNKKPYINSNNIISNPINFHNTCQTT